MNSIFLFFYNKINFLLDYIYFLYLPKRTRSINPRTLLLVRLDAIGDYILFRNFIEAVFNSKKYRDYKITLCGNIEWKEIAEIHDKKFISQFIWIDRNKFGLNPIYRFKIANIIYRKGFEIAIESTYSREIHFGDFIIRASYAFVRIGNSGEPLKIQRWKRKFISDKYYTNIVKLKQENLFEFKRNKEFFEAALDENLNISRPNIDINLCSPFNIKNEFITIFIGGRQKQKKWNFRKYADLLNMIIKNFKYYIIVLGSNKESKLAGKIIDLISEKSNISNLAGKTTLNQLISIIYQSQLLISNESMAVHLAAALNHKFVCISNGNSWGRFLPYPNEIQNKGIYIIPNILKHTIEKKEINNEKLRYNSTININLIRPNEVYEAVSKSLNTDI